MRDEVDGLVAPVHLSTVVEVQEKRISCRCYAGR